MPDGCLDENAVAGFFQGSLGAPELAELDHHLDGCAACRVLLSSLAVGEVRLGPFSATRFSSHSRGLRSEAPANEGARHRFDAGTVLSQRFAIEKLVGVGGMAAVYRALDRQTGSPVAVKTTHPSSLEDMLRFEREAQLLLQLHHPAIVGYVTHGQSDDGTPYLVMEWLEGEDLAARLRRGPVGVQATAQLGARVASALAAAQEVGIVHRDIKPSNIFLPQGDVTQATVLDFGVGRQGVRDTATLGTRTGALLGTLGYMAPEQALGAKTADARADIFSLGCVLFECLAGRRLFEGAHAVEVLAKVLTQPIVPPRSLVAEIPPALDALILRMLDRDPAARPSDPSKLAALLEAFANGGVAVGAASARRGGQPRRGRSRWIPAGAAGAAVLVAGVVASRSLHLAEHSSVVASQDPRVAPSAPQREDVPVGVAFGAMPARTVVFTGDAPPASARAVPPPIAPRPQRSKAAPVASPLPPASFSASDPFGTSRN